MKDSDQTARVAYMPTCIFFSCSHCMSEFTRYPKLHELTLMSKKFADSFQMKNELNPLLKYRLELNIWLTISTLNSRPDTLSNVFLKIRPLEGTICSGFTLVTIPFLSVGF